MGLDVLTMSVADTHTEEKISTALPAPLSQVLKKGDTSVTFDVPIDGENFIDIYTSKDGLDYVSLDDSTAGKLTITYDAQGSDVTVFLKITGGQAE